MMCDGCINDSKTGCLMGYDDGVDFITCCHYYEEDRVEENNGTNN